jgi:hypothetical protein
MMTTKWIAIVFAILGTVFLMLAVRSGPASPPARHTWGRTGVIFVAVAAALYFLVR